MAWRVARSLDQLLAQLNALAPNRSRASDGSIGDAAHQLQGSASDHNPWYLGSVVTARDFTHDPANGLDCNKLASALVASRDPRIKYLIWQGRICDSRPQFSPWQWKPSSGHYQHLHLSVMANGSADDPRPWSLPGLSPQEDDLNKAQNDALAETWNAVGRKGAGGKPIIQLHVEFVVEELTRRMDARFAQIQAEINQLKASGIPVKAEVDWAEGAVVINDEDDRRDRDGDPKTGATS